MVRKNLILPCLAPLLMAWSPARAHLLWLGVYDHDVTLAQTKFETGADVKAGWIGERIAALGLIGSPAPYALVSKSLGDGTDYAAIGLGWRLGGRLYARPGIGLALNNGPSRAYRGGKRVDLGSPITFEPEIAVGYRLNDRISIEASWIHLSHATLFSRQNRGMDSWGVRMLLDLP